jgi:protein ImuA
MPASTLSSGARMVVAQLPHAIWRADQMGSYRTAVTPSGYPALDAELPHGGWPSAALIELLLQQPGIGEMRLLRPALAGITQARRIALVQPPYLPQVAAWSAWGLPPERLLWIRTRRSADALWSAEQIVRNGSCGALLLWQAHIRPEALRRLHLAAQASETVFWMLRPLAAAQDASPAPLRLALRAAQAGLEIAIVKRRGPLANGPLYLQLETLPAAPATPYFDHHAHVDQRASAAIRSRDLASALV